jgi:hypothetical protein
MIETVLTCPLGHTCEETRDGKIYRCRWLISLAKGDERGNIAPGTEYDECAIAMQSVHLTELKKSSLGVQGAVESRLNKLIMLAEGPPVVRRLTDDEEDTGTRKALQQ